MNTGGPTGPAENREELDRTGQEGNSKIDQVRKVGKYCKELLLKPQIQIKITEFHQGKITKAKLEELFKKELGSKSDAFKKQIGIGSGDGAFDAFLVQTKCFENQFFYEITHNKKLKDKAQEEMLDSCLGTIRDEYEITASQEVTVREYLKREESTQGLNIFLESGKKRKKVLKKALPSMLVEKTLDDIDFNGIHSKIANLPPTDPNSRRIQDIWSTMLGGIKIQDGEDITAAFRRIQEEGGEGDLTADYEAFFSCPDTLISQVNKEKIRNFLIRQYTPTVSLEALWEIDQAAAQKLLDEYQVDTHAIASPDNEWENAINAQRSEGAQQSRRDSLMSHPVITTGLDMRTQLRILGGLSSVRRLQQKNDFARGHIMSSKIPTRNYEETFESTYGFKTDDIMTDSALVEKLEEEPGNRFKNLDKFGPGAIMRWRNKGLDGKDMIGYYAIESTLGDTLSEEGEPGEIKLRFLGNNQNGGKLSRSGIPQTKTGPQFFEYLDSCVDSGEVDFIGDDGTLGGDDMKRVMTQDSTSFYTDIEAKKELKARYGNVDIVGEDDLNAEVEALLQGKNGNKLESEDPASRVLCSGMTFALCKSDDIDTFEIEEIVEPTDGNPGYVKIWDGWGSGEDARRELSFRDFVNQLKHFKSSYGSVYRVPFGKKGDRMGSEQFNLLMKSEPHAFEGRHKKHKRVAIQDGMFGQFDANGNFSQKSIVKVGDNKDLHISNIEGNMVTVSQGTFKQTVWDEKTGKFTQKPEFSGSHPYQIPLTLLWSYLQKNSYDLTKEDIEPKYKQQKGGNGGLGWWNILKHSHSLGVLLHGDLWKAPFKAWEEQHHKDHAFHGKLTAALAIEKMQSGKGPISGMLNWAEWPSLMVADSNGSFQSYLDELVNKVDGMGSVHRTRLIKKWARSEHFPSPKFMAAMFASMKIFGQLYPYNKDNDDPRNKDHHGHPCHEWFWYNSIRHSAGIALDGFPAHMPAHPPEKAPTNKQGEPLTEIQACQELFQAFKHPILQNLGRRYQKYMNAGHKELITGGEGNLNQRDTMEEKLKWMMSTIISGKPTEAFGSSTDLWLGEGYPTHVSTMPYAAMLFGNREQQLLPSTQEHLRSEFLATTKVPMFVFAQNQNLGDTFRETGIAFAYTMDPKEGDTENPGSQLEKLIKAATPRISGPSTEAWSKKFQMFWTRYGTELMHKMTGMRDPMLNLMINDRPLFNELLENVPEHKKVQYNELKKRSGKIEAYYGRLFENQSSPDHSAIRGKGKFYDGDHFRFRKNFDNGYPMFWIDWDGYIDANLDAAFVAGDGTKGDGIFNEMRGFFDAMPEMAKEMAKKMGMEGNKKYIDRICRSLYEKNIKGIKPILQKRKFNNDVKAVYFNVSSMILGFADVRQLTQTAAGPKAQERFEDYKNKMDEINVRAAEIADSEGFAASMKYRTEMWQRFEEIVEAEISTQKLTLDQVFKREYSTSHASADTTSLKNVTSQTLEETESVLRNNFRDNTSSGSTKNDIPTTSQKHFNSPSPIGHEDAEGVEG